MPPAERRRVRARDLVWFSVAVFLPVPWVVAQALGGLGIMSEFVALLAGLAILGAAFLLSWSCEVAEQDIPQALALLVLALAGVLGLGWAAVVLVSCWRSGDRELQVHPRQSLEIRFLIWATLYSFVIPLSGSIHLFDAAVLLGLFVLYVREAMKGQTDEVELVGPAALIERAFDDWGRRGWALGLFVFAAYAIFVSAEPFAESLVHLGRSYDIDEFLLVQWVAPLASESPEFVVAVLFALKLRGTVGIGVLVSSKVNQWTLLVGAIPIAYALSLGGLAGLPLDGRQVQELLLTSSQSLLAAILLADLRFSRMEALVLAVLFLIQLVFPSPFIRSLFIVLYLAASVGFLLVGPQDERRAFFRLAFSLPSADLSPGPTSGPGASG